MAWKFTCPHPQQVSAGSRAWHSTGRTRLQLLPRPSQRGTGAWYPTSAGPIACTFHPLTPPRLQLHSHVGIACFGFRVCWAKSS